MAWVYNLLDSSTTITLNGGTNYALMPDGFSAPPPPRRQTFGGRNYFRDGSDLMERVFENRTVTVRIWIKGSSQDNLIANINAVNNLLERGAEYARTGLGTQLLLRRQWDNATNTSDFSVIEGHLQIDGDAGDVHRFSPSTDYRISAILVLVCQPFILGDAETIENFIDNASFEITGTDLADWTQNIDATGSTALDTTQKKYGLASMKLTMTDSAGSGRVVERTQVRAEVDATEVWSFSVWVHVTALSSAKAGLVLLYDDGSATTTTLYQTSVTSDWTLLSLANQTAPSGAGQVTIKLRLESTAADATGVAYFDGATAVLSSSLPDSFVTSRNVANSYADNSQATTNYIDVYPNLGDIPALMQVRVAENEAHTSMYVGARHAGRHTDTNMWIEGIGSSSIIHDQANFLETQEGNQAGMNTGAPALDSGSVVTTFKIVNATGGTADLAADTWFRGNTTITTPPEGQYRVLFRVGFRTNIGAIASEELHFGMSYTYGAFTLLDDTNPSTANFTAFASSATERVGHLLDLGTINIPPIGTPEGQTGADFVLKIFLGTNAANSSDNSDYLEFYTDAFMLVPIDFGGLYLSKDSAQDVVLLDSRSKNKAAYILDTSNVVQSFPSNQLGTMPTAHPEGTRLYFAFGENADNDWVIASGAAVSVTVVPRFLYVR
jgi:hypothetical protein